MASRWVPQLTFRAIDPRNFGEHWKVGVPPWLFDLHVKHDHEKELGRLLLVRDVLEDDSSEIYEGWCRPGKDGCYAYAGHPNRDFKSLTIQTPPPPNMSFVVFILTDGSIDLWTWRPIERGGAPEEITGRLIWPLNQS